MAKSSHKERHPLLAVLQFDSASVPRLERMLAAGRLPTLAGIRERGRHYDLDPGSTILFPSAAYPTLYSGLEIADHGIYSAFPWSPAEQRVRFMRSRPLPRTIWERLPANRRALVVDPYDHWPPRTGEGVFISGWQYRNRVMALERWSVPRDAYRTLSRRFGSPPLVEDSYGAQPARRLLEVRRHLLAAPARVSALIRDLLGRERFDLVWASFSAAHFAGHFFWDTSQIGDSDTLAAGERAALEGVLEDVYETVDTAIGEILAAIGPDADVIVLSPIGMGTFTSRSDVLPELLAAVVGDGSDGAAAGSTIFRLRAAVPSWLRAALARTLPSAVVHGLAARLYLQGVDWSRTRAIALPGEHNGYVRLNVRSRERDGIVAPEHVDQVIEELVEGLATFRDEDGGAAIAAVERPHVGEGPGVALLPDLVVRWSDRPSASTGTLRSERFGEVRRRGKMGLSGHHRDGAWAVVMPGTSRLCAVGRRPRLVDVASTICAILGGDTVGLQGEPLLTRC
jgi:predicted AlkP superfamily phosphohydrolase/phosphomutase